jgi:vancomycin resistance protein YoaR
LRAETTIYRTGARRRRQSSVLRWALVASGVAVAAVLLICLVFAGSPSTLAAGTTIDGVDVGGLTKHQAEARLGAQAEAISGAPVVFAAAGKTFSYSASQLGVLSDWRGAIAEAAHDGGGFWPVRAFRRLHTRLFGDHLTAHVTAYQTPLAYAVGTIAREVDETHVDASVVRHGLSIAIVPGAAGRQIDQRAAANVIVQSLGGVHHPTAVSLPVRSLPPAVTAAELARAAAQARVVLSAPVRLVHGTTVWRIPRWRLAQLLQLPADGRTKLAIAGATADAYFANLDKSVARRPVDATFRILAGSRVGVVPSRPGLALDELRTARALLLAARSRAERTAQLVVRVAQPQRSTADAQAMGVVGEVSSYSTTYGGTPGRLHNVALVARLIDGALIAPGATFSFNKTTGARTAAKGFEVAPVIMNGELTTGLGGGVCQVSTTTFNAAFFAGVPIIERTNHALYISHYPLGRDATVDYPDVDLQFKNDTGHWLWLRTFVGTGSLTVALYGTPTDRRIAYETAPLTVTGPTPVTITKDPTLPKGKIVVDHVGAPPTATSVTRKVYDANGKLLYDTTWHSSYVADAQLERVGTKKATKKPPPKNGAPAPSTAPGTSRAG